MAPSSTDGPQADDAGSPGNVVFIDTNVFFTFCATGQMEFIERYLLGGIATTEAVRNELVPGAQRAETDRPVIDTTRVLELMTSGSIPVLRTNSKETSQARVIQRGMKTEGRVNWGECTLIARAPRSGAFLVSDDTDARFRAHDRKVPCDTTMGLLVAVARRNPEQASEIWKVARAVARRQPSIMRGMTFERFEELSHQPGWTFSDQGMIDTAARTKPVRMKEPVADDRLLPRSPLLDQVPADLAFYPDVQMWVRLIRGLPDSGPMLEHLGRRLVMTDTMFEHLTMRAAARDISEDGLAAAARMATRVDAYIEISRIQSLQATLLETDPLPRDTRATATHHEQRRARAWANAEAMLLSLGNASARSRRTGRYLTENNGARQEARKRGGVDLTFNALAEAIASASADLRETMYTAYAAVIPEHRRMSEAEFGKFQDAVLFSLGPASVASGAVADAMRDRVLAAGNRAPVLTTDAEFDTAATSDAATVYPKTNIEVRWMLSDFTYQPFVRQDIERVSQSLSGILDINQIKNVSDAFSTNPASFSNTEPVPGSEQGLRTLKVTRAIGEPMWLYYTTGQGHGPTSEAVFIVGMGPAPTDGNYPYLDAEGNDLSGPMGAYMENRVEKFLPDQDVYRELQRAARKEQESPRPGKGKSSKGRGRPRRLDAGSSGQVRAFVTRPATQPIGTLVGQYIAARNEASRAAAEAVDTRAAETAARAKGEIEAAAAAASAAPAGSSRHEVLLSGYLVLQAAAEQAGDFKTATALEAMAQPHQARAAAVAPPTSHTLT